MVGILGACSLWGLTGFLSYIVQFFFWVSRFLSFEMPY